MPDPRRTAEHLTAIVDDLAHPDPLPASGAAAVATASVGLGLALMATQKPRPGAEGRLADEEVALRELRRRMDPLLEADCAAFHDWIAADDAARPKARLRAMAIPLDIVDVAVAAIERIDAMADAVRPALATDVAAARSLLFAGAEVSLRNATSNREFAVANGEWTDDADGRALSERIDRTSARLARCRLDAG